MINSNMAGRLKKYQADKARDVFNWYLSSFTGGARYG